MTYTKDNIVFEPIPIIHNFVNLTGQIFGHLTVLGYAGKNSYLRTCWLCECQCGTIARISSSSLQEKRTKSCGCQKYRTGHGETSHSAQSTEYKAFYSARHRCTNPTADHYHRYGGRGIEFRFTSFKDFLAAVGRKPTPEHTLDRINNDGHYEKGNLHWTTRTFQSRNTHTNRIITLGQESKCVAEWASILHKSPTTLFKRLFLGWCDECVIRQPRRGKCIHLITSRASRLIPVQIP